MYFSGSNTLVKSAHCWHFQYHLLHLVNVACESPLYRKDYWERDYQCLNDTPRRTLHGKLTQWGKTLQEPPIYFLLLIRQLLFENLTQVFFKKLISVALSLFCGHKKSNAVSIRLWPSFVLRALLSNPSARLGFRLSCVRAWRHARRQKPGLGARPLGTQ